MELTIKGKTFHIWNKKRILYTICFFLLCLIDQRTKTGSGLDGAIEVFRNLTGVVMAVIIFSHYKWKEIAARKWPYLVWTVIGVAIGAAYVIFGQPLQYYRNGRFVAALDILLFGYVMIHTFIAAVIEKKLPEINKKFLIFWVVMMLLMIFSRSNYIWPFCYLVMFGCLYLTDFTKEEQEDLFQGCLNGILLGFFVFQAYCCMFRPYDEIRYKGIYNNSNIAVTFYLVVLGVVFAKILYVTKEKKHKAWRIFYWLGAGVLYAFVFMSIGRTAWVASFLMGLVFLAWYCIYTGKKVFLRSGMLLLLCACLMLPVTYSLVRYIPPFFHHPVWFWGEWNEGKVHSWDAWDSGKYTDFTQLIGEALGRVAEITDRYAEANPLIIHAKAAEQTDQRWENAVFKMAEIDPILVRKTIYSHYLSNLNLTGHRTDEQGFQLSPYFWVGHAHNIFLQYATDFGIPMAICFIILNAWGIVVLVKNIMCNKSISAAGFLFMMMVPLLFGMLEYAWGTGSITVILLFMAWREAMILSK